MLLVVPLGVLAAVDAARLGRHAWFAALVALLVIAPIAARLEPLAATVQNLVNPACPCGSDLGEQSRLVFLAGQMAALLPIPLATLIYSVMPEGRAAHAPVGLGRGTRRLIILCAVIGFVVMGALGYLVNSDFILTHFGSGTVAHIMFVGALRQLLDQVWFALLDALMVAVASLALAHAVATGRHEWRAGWIAIVVLAMVTANFFVLATSTWLPLPITERLAPYQPQLQDISAAMPGVVMLLALVYAATMRPPRAQLQAALA